MNELLLWLVIFLAGFVFGMVFALTLSAGWRGPTQPTVMMAPPPPPATLEDQGCASTLIGFVFLLILLFLLWLMLSM